MPSREMIVAILTLSSLSVKETMLSFDALSEGIVSLDVTAQENGHLMRVAVENQENGLAVLQVCRSKN